MRFAKFHIVPIKIKGTFHTNFCFPTRCKKAPLLFTSISPKLFTFITISRFCLKIDVKTYSIKELWAKSVNRKKCMGPVKKSHLSIFLCLNRQDGLKAAFIFSHLAAERDIFFNFSRRIWVSWPKIGLKNNSRQKNFSGSILPARGLISYIFDLSFQMVFGGFKVVER